MAHEERRRLRDEVRAFLAEHAPAAADLPRSLDARIEALRGWQASCYRAGYVGRAWPREFGGGGRAPVEQIIVDQELAAAGAPEFVNVVGLDVLGPSLLRFGTEQQRQRHIAPILDAREIWCQGFSEPEAGSDLASLRTSAARRDGHFVLNGQKTWVSWGQFARWCGVLARTEGHDRPRHQGISMLIVDMNSPGVDVRPMTQITGHAEFCELFFDDVLVPERNLLSDRGDGWKIAMYTLGHERGTAALPRQVKLRTWLDRLAAALGDRALDGRALLDDLGAQASLAQAMIGIEVLRYHAQRTVGEFLSGGAVGPDSSTVKLLMAEAEQRLAATAVELLGPVIEQVGPAEQDEDAFWEETYLYSRAASVYGGTRQIQRNIIADRVLALPQELAMELELTEEQSWISESIGTLLSREWVAPGEVVGAPAEQRRRAWAALVEFGALGIGDGDGGGLGAVELGLIARSLGHHLASVPFLGSAAVRLALAPEARSLPPELAGLLSSQDAIGIALLEPGSCWTVERAGTRLFHGRDGLEIRGEKVAIEQLAEVGQLAVFAMLDGEPALAVTPADAAGLTRQAQRCFDETVLMGTACFDAVAVPGSSVLGGPQARTVLRRLMTAGSLLAAAEAVGAAGHILDLACRYAGQRRQFGRTIGSFQALRHILADAYVRQESGWSAVRYAAAAFDDGDPEAAQAASIAKAYVSRGAREVAHSAMQVFGGIAFTAEHPAHRFLRRIGVRALQFGDAAHHERLLGRDLAERTARARPVLAEACPA